MTTNPDHVAINIAELKQADGIDGPHKKHHSPKHTNGHGHSLSNGHRSDEDYDSSSESHHGHHHHHRHHDRGHRNPSYHSGSETDTEDEDEEDSHRRRHRTHHHRTPSPARHHHSPSRRTRRDVEATPERSPRSKRDLEMAKDDAEPLLDTELVAKRPTELTPEDETPDDSVPNTTGHHPGVDDGFFGSTVPTTTTTTDFEGAELVPRLGADGENEKPKVHPTNDAPLPEFPFAPGFNPNVILDANGNPQVIPDINVYQQKKNLAQGMMDLALLSANANQLRYVIESYPRHPYYWFSFISITISLVLQVCVGVGLILNSRYNVKNREDICRADKINNATVIGIFLITTVNVFITAFGVAEAMPPATGP